MKNKVHGYACDIERLDWVMEHHCVVSSIGGDYMKIEWVTKAPVADYRRITEVDGRHILKEDIGIWFEDRQLWRVAIDKAMKIDESLRADTLNHMSSGSGESKSTLKDITLCQQVMTNPPIMEMMQDDSSKVVIKGDLTIVGEL